MASILQSPVSSAARRQSTTMPLRFNASLAIAPPRSTCSSFSTLCSPSTNSPFHPSKKRSNSLPTLLPTQQSRTFLAQLRRQTQAQISRVTSPAKQPPSPKNSPPPTLQLTNLPYFIRRTPSNQLPVYLITKAGGTKQQTKIQKTEGDMDALRDDLALYLGMESGDPRAPKSSDIAINRLNGHIVVKGWRKPEILQFLKERNF